MRVVFWQNELSFHQVSFIRAVSRLTCDEVVWVVEREISDQRRAQGWPVPDAQGVRVVSAPPKCLTRQLISERLDDSIHVFSGIRAYPTVWFALQSIPAKPGLRFLMAEPGVTFLDWKAPRMLRSMWDCRRTGRTLDAVLAIGDYGVTWYENVGYREKVFPFAYFLDPVKETLLDRPGDSTGKTFHIIYAGRLLETKGVTDLLRAVAGLAAEPWELEIIGDGPDADKCRAAASQLRPDIAARVRFLGAMGNDAAMALLARADLLVQPSRGIEGWGVVVNEALLRGVPVLCTDRVGANVLVRASGAGSVVPTCDVSALREALRCWIRRGPLSSSEKSRVQRWSKRIGGDSAAQYFLKIARFCQSQGDRPEPPWSEAIRESDGAP